MNATLEKYSVVFGNVRVRYRYYRAYEVLDLAPELTSIMTQIARATGLDAYETVAHKLTSELLTDTDVLGLDGRFYCDVNSTDLEPLPRGGVTICELVDHPSGEILATGRAVCCDKDNYCYRTGRVMSIARAHAELIVRLADEAELQLTYHHSRKVTE